MPKIFAQHCMYSVILCFIKNIIQINTSWTSFVLKKSIILSGLEFCEMLAQEMIGLQFLQSGRRQIVADRLFFFTSIKKKCLIGMRGNKNFFPLSWNWYSMPFRHSWGDIQDPNGSQENTPTPSHSTDSCCFLQVLGLPSSWCKSHLDLHNPSTFSLLRGTF